MEVGPFRTVPASQTESGEVEVRLVVGWEEFATVVFGKYSTFPSFIIMSSYDLGSRRRVDNWRLVDQPPGTGLSYVPTNGYVHDLEQVSYTTLHLTESKRGGCR